MRKIVNSDIVILSGVNPWTSATVTILGKFLKKFTIVDFHGFAWYEAIVAGNANSILRVVLLVSERLTYTMATYITAASNWLAKVLNEYLGTNHVFILPNSVTPIFENIVKRFKHYDVKMLRRFVCSKILDLRECEKYLLFVAPLPKVFTSNVLAYKMLLELINKLPQNAIVVVTGLNNRDNRGSYSNRVIHTGYLTYPKYVALLLSCDAVILPYPSNAICGGARNKVLEAGYCKKPVITTKIGAMHIPALPRIDYILINDLDEDIVKVLRKNQTTVMRFSKLVFDRYTYSAFKLSFLRFLKKILMTIWS
jgi:glycosyltransferase involved in cell wall biosynthesis